MGDTEQRQKRAAQQSAGSRPGHPPVLLVVRTPLPDHAVDVPKRPRQRLARVADCITILGPKGNRRIRHAGSERLRREAHRRFVIDVFDVLIDAIEATGHFAKRGRVVGELVLGGSESFDCGTLQGYFPAQLFKGFGSIVGR